MTTSTWRENFEERIKIPAIGTEAWFACCDPGPLLAEAKRLVEEKHKVVVEPSAAVRPGASAIYLIKFESTEFVAGWFNDQALANEYASVWNKQCA